MRRPPWPTEVPQELKTLLQGAEPVAALSRGGWAEGVHLAHGALVDAEGRLLASLGRPGVAIFPRSSLKPFQALPLWLAELDRRWALPTEAQAIALASHGGAPMHLAWVDHWLALAQAPPEALICPAKAPLWAPAANELLRAGEAPTPRHQNCSGQHAYLLALAKAQGQPQGSYGSPDHPSQRWIRALLAQLADLPEEAIGQGPDGCGLPAWRLPLASLAGACARLGRPEALEAPLARACRQAVAAMRAHPELVCDPDRLDARLMRACPGPGGWVTKAGAEGVHVGAWPERGWGWALKILDGQRRAVPAALGRLLEQAGGVPQAAVEALGLEAGLEAWP